MKRLFLFAALLSITFSCDEDDDNINEQDQSSEIIGKWVYLQTEHYENNELVVSEISIHNFECPDYLEFMENNQHQTVSYTLNCDIEDQIIGSYTYLNNTLTLDHDDESLSFEVIELNEEVLITESTFTETYMGETIEHKELVYYDKLN